MQEAADELRKSASRARNVQIGSTVNILVSLMERMTAALRLDTLNLLHVQ